jgi:phospholipase A1
MFHLRSVKLALAHKSNGQPDTTNVIVDGVAIGNKSRSINYLYTMFRMQHGALVSDVTLRVPVFENIGESDNADIMDYYGYAQVKWSYFYKKHMMTLMVRGNIKEQHGAVEATYSYPLHNEYVNAYVKFFSGYGESLIDYNNRITKLSIGFSFSR